MLDGGCSSDNACPFHSRAPNRVSRFNARADGLRFPWRRCGVGLFLPAKEPKSPFDQLLQLVFPTVVKPLVQNLKAKLMLIKTFPELLPGDFLARSLEIPSNLALVFSVRITL